MLGHDGIGLFDEARDFVHARRISERIAAFDVAEAGFGRPGLHAEGHDAAGARRDHRCLEVGPQRVGVGNVVIGRQHPQYLVRIVLGRDQRRRSDGRRTVAALGFQDDAGADDAGGAHLFGDEKAVLLIADDERGGEAGHGGAQGGVLEQGMVRDEGPELLGETGAGDGPQAGA